MKLNRVFFLAILVCLIVVMSGCSESASSATYQKISAQEAKKMMDSTDTYTLIDVRTKEEYEQGHIPGAILVPNETIDTEMPKELTDTKATILVYCRSGNRSAQASEKLAKMGYENVYDFGGINEWPYDIEK